MFTVGICWYHVLLNCHSSDLEIFPYIYRYISRLAIYSIYLKDGRPRRCPLYIVPILHKEFDVFSSLWLCLIQPHESCLIFTIFYSSKFHVDTYIWGKIYLSKIKGSLFDSWLSSMHLAVWHVCLLYCVLIWLDWGTAMLLPWCSSCQKECEFHLTYMWYSWANLLWQALCSFIGGHELSKSTGNAGGRVACGEFYCSNWFSCFLSCLFVYPCPCSFQFCKLRSQLYL